MNIKISKEHRERLSGNEFVTFLFGSRLFGTNSEASDYDFLKIYDYESVFGAEDTYLPNIHSFQFDGNNEQEIWMTERQFFLGACTGDGTIQTDIIMLNTDFQSIYSFIDPLKYCRTYKIIRAYCGVAKRDLRWKQPKKDFHAARGLYIAECLLKNELPTVEGIKKLKDFDREKLYKKTRSLRELAGNLYNKGELQNYFIPHTDDGLLQQLWNTNNTKEFKYI